MNTSGIGPHLNHLDSIRSFEDAVSAGLAHPAVALPMSPMDRLARIRADRELILSGLEGTPAPPYTAMPAIQAPTTIVIGSLELPSQGYATREPEEPSAQAGPVTPDLLDQTPSGLGDATAPAGTVTDGEVQAGIEAGVESGTDAGLERGVQGLVAANSTGTSVTKRELAFLDDKSLSIEEKLFQFMVLMTKKGDQELVAAMKQADGKRGTTSSSSSSGSSSGSGSSSATSGAGSSSGASASSSGADSSSATGSSASSDSGDGSGFLDDVQSFVHDHAGDAMALAATAMGFPELAPIAKLAGPIVTDAVEDGVGAAGNLIASGASEVGGFIGKGISAFGSALGFLEADDPSAQLPAGDTARTGGAAIAAAIRNAASAVAAQVDEAVDAPATAAAASSSSTKSTSSSASSTSETLDEKLVMFNLERAVQKQNDMFAALSNILKSFDDTRMSIIQNLR